MSQSAPSNRLLETLGEIVGPGYVRPASAADAIDGVRPQLVVEPATPSEVARVLAAANETRLHVIPRGGRTKLDCGNAPRAAEIVLSTHRLNRVLEHAAGDLTATVEAGCTIAALQRTLAERGQRLAIDPLWPDQATIGGVFATADCGSLRSAFGPPRDLILGVTVALADGTLARSGGKVVKNVAGYDLPKLLTGSYGTLGVITQITLRLHPLPEATRHLDFALPDGAVSRFVSAMRECSLLTAGVQIKSQNDTPPTAQVRIESASEATAAKVERVTAAAVAAGASPTAPSDWSKRESLFSADEIHAVCKVSVLPTQLGELLSLLARIASDGGVRWRFIGQLVGVGLLRIESHEPSRLLAAFKLLRNETASLAASLVVLRCPSQIKSQLDVWGDPGDALPLMRRLKQRFDPNGILAPGRFLGGI